MGVGKSFLTNNTVLKGSVDRIGEKFVAESDKSKGRTWEEEGVGAEACSRNAAKKEWGAQKKSDNGGCIDLKRGLRMPFGEKFILGVVKFKSSIGGRNISLAAKRLKKKIIGGGEKEGCKKTVVMS